MDMSWGGADTTLPRERGTTNPCGGSDLRTYAMLTLAHSLGLRGKEISLITLDDISFKKREELSVSASKSIKKETVEIVMKFD